eukprot:COSAG05_NODE_1032_length_6088_cov_23.885624_3_plen_637_part_00
MDALGFSDFCFAWFVHSVLSDVVAAASAAAASAAAASAAAAAAPSSSSSSSSSASSASSAAATKLSHLVLLLSTLHADMLVVEDFFYKMERFHRQVIQHCPTAVISGFASNLRSWDAIGANLMFSNTSYLQVVGNRSIKRDIWNSYGTQGVVKPWDQQVALAFTSQCGPTKFPWTPNSSYAHHLGFSDGQLHERDENILRLMSNWSWRDNQMGLHNEHDQLAELSLRFQWDPFTLDLASAFNPLFAPSIEAASQFTMYANDTATCFTGGHEGAYLLSCAVALDIVFRHCIEFSTLEDAQIACLEYETCGGITEAAQGVFSLRSGSKLVKVPPHDGCRNWILPRSWVRMTHAQISGATTSSVQCKFHASELRRRTRCRDCADCKTGELNKGGVKVVHGHCRDFCSVDGFCGNSAEYIRSGTDCRDCETPVVLDDRRRLTFDHQRQPLKLIARPAVDTSGQKTVPNHMKQHSMSYNGPTALKAPDFPERASMAPRVSREHWGIVFPFHGAPGSTREKVAHFAWLSICRAMRVAKRATFHIIAIDDMVVEDPVGASDRLPAVNRSDFNGRTNTHFDDGHFSSQRSQEQWLREWRVSCDTPNLQTLLHVEGRKSIAKNMKMGYEWASQYHYIMNLDSGAW